MEDSVSIKYAEGNETAEGRDRVSY